MAFLQQELADGIHKLRLKSPHRIWQHGKGDHIVSCDRAKATSLSLESQCTSAYHPCAVSACLSELMEKVRKKERGGMGAECQVHL